MSERETVPGVGATAPARTASDAPSRTAGPGRSVPQPNSQPGPRRSPLQPPVVGGESVFARQERDDTARDTGSEVDADMDSASDVRVGLPAERVESVASSQPLSAGFGSEPEVSGSGVTAGRGAQRGDRVFLGLSGGAAWLVIAIVVLIAVFLLIKSIPAIANDKVNFLTSSAWSPEPGNLRFGIAPLLWVTVIISLIALLIAVPIAIGVALFVTQYAPKRLAKPIAYIVDLLAAVPSIVYGIWGVYSLTGALEPVQRVLSHIPLPLFGVKSSTGTIFDGAVVLAVMILPIITAISRDVFERTPRANIEAALALGATKWEMIRTSVLPYGRPGVVSGAMLGLGRALGETIAVYLIVSTVSPPFHVSIFTGGETFASKIANGYSEFNNPSTTGAYIAAGLVLFVLTFVVNSAARTIVNRRRDFS